MSLPKTEIKGPLIIDGLQVTPDSTIVTSLQQTQTQYQRNVEGTTVPTDGETGYGKGCQFVKTNGTLGTTTYINEGDETACDFNAVEPAGSSITGVTAGTGLTGGGMYGTVTVSIANSGVTATQLASNAVETAKILDANVTYAKIANGTGTSVVGKATTGAGVNADITGTDGQALRVSGTTVGFGTLATAAYGDASVTGAKLVTTVGYFAVTVPTNATTPVNILGATVPFNASITGVFVESLDTTAGNITVANTSGTVATIAKGTSAGVMVGGGTLTNTALTAGDTFTVVSDSAGEVRLTVTFTVA